MKHVPKYWKIDNRPIGELKYGFGYWTGPQNDLLCIKPNIETNEEAERSLSPIHRTKKEARNATLKK